MQNGVTSPMGDDELNRMLAGLQNSNGASSNAGSFGGQAPTSGVGQGQMTDPQAGTSSNGQVPVQDFGQTPANPTPLNNNADQFGQYGDANLGQGQNQSQDQADMSVSQSAAPTPAVELSQIKDEAIHALRPLVDKLAIAPEDKFDTLLLLIRTTNDSTLLADAYDTAQRIGDDSRRAQALLDVIKEIDYFSSHQN